MWPKGDEGRREDKAAELHPVTVPPASVIRVQTRGMSFLRQIIRNGSMNKKKMIYFLSGKKERRGRRNGRIKSTEAEKRMAGANLACRPVGGI